MPMGASRCPQLFVNYPIILQSAMNADVLVTIKIRDVTDIRIRGYPHRNFTSVPKRVQIRMSKMLRFFHIYKKKLAIFEKFVTTFFIFDIKSVCPKEIFTNLSKNIF